MPSHSVEQEGAIRLGVSIVSRRRGITAYGAGVIGVAGARVIVSRERASSVSRERAAQMANVGAPEAASGT